MYTGVEISVGRHRLSEKFAYLPSGKIQKIFSPFLAIKY